MKKTLLTLSLVVAALGANAQVDTLSAHSDPAGLYTGVIDAVAPIDSGFVAGTNMYGDLAKMQLFDATHGVTSGGTITGIAVLTIAKVDGGGSMQFAIWSDNNGEPNAVPVAMKTVTMASIDTTVASTQFLADGNFFNNVIMFDAPVTIPAGNKFWAGFILPNPQANLFATAISMPNSDALTHTGEFWSDASFHTFAETGNWELDASITVFPIVDLVASLEENVITANVYPNPANDVLNIELNGEEVASVIVTTLDGKTVVTGNTASVNVDGLASGMYLYHVTTVAGKLATGNFVKK